MDAQTPQSPPLRHSLPLEIDDLLRDWLDWFTAFSRHNRLPSWPIALRGGGNPDDLLMSFFVWWRSIDTASKLPHALHVETACYLTMRSVETGHDLTGGILEGRIPDEGWPQ